MTEVTSISESPRNQATTILKKSIRRGAHTVDVVPLWCGCIAYTRVVLHTFSTNLQTIASSWKPKKVHTMHVR